MVSGDELANLRTGCGSTPLHIAAEVGNTVAADIMCRKMPRLPYIQDYNEDFPVHTAAKNEHAAILRLLIGITTEEEPYQNKGGLRLISDTIHAQFFGIAFSLVEKHPYLATLHDPTIGSALSTIAGKESMPLVYLGDGVIAYNEESHSYLQNKARLLVALLCKNMESMEFNEAIHIAHHAVICATKIGNHEIVEMIIEAFPNAIYSSYMESSPRSIFHLAVLNRCEEVFKLLYHMNGHKFVYSDVVDNSGNNLLHMAAKLAPSHKLNQISGAALKMQREIQWYLLVEKLVARSSKIQINNKGKTPKMVFTEEHKNLEEEGAKWMKETSQNCTVVASLIATFMFSCAFMVPGGNDGNTGLPIFYRQRMFFGVRSFRRLAPVSGISPTTSIETLKILDVNKHFISFRASVSSTTID
ncbi:PREDICTED: uncharacterized protein LOC105959118 [Erythranthe guttata]|uniref:uncharacterized protein LOC105959118 n=1 Tax=Erythranthe guttata TaxID=4155 RepID=UPI00064E0D9E|nr:PREDICTED: uncharacterized protein LOC105959118 [Erythranthe guttata]|eukprot:XP_012838608.1 PREDICTED: uncharacterized protein LOC105959118 [Erythranthe guttata]